MRAMDGSTYRGRAGWLLAIVAVAALLGVTLTPASADPDATQQSHRADDPSSLPSGRTEFRTLADYEHDMTVLERRYPRTVRKFALPHKTTDGRTVHGVEITRNVHAKDGKPVFVDVGAHHGDEWPSSELTMEFAYYLASNQRDPFVREALRTTRVVVVPIVNPDGLVADTRETAAGVDMNRNYGFGWMPGDDADHGDGPWSEPESRNVRWLLSTRQATVLNTQHTCIQVVLYPPLQHEAGPAQDVGRLHAMAASMAGELGPTYRALASADDYETTGEAIDWSYFATRGLSVTTETCPNKEPEGHAFRSEVVRTFDRNTRAMTEALETAGDPREHATIVGRAPVGSTLTLRKSFRMYTGSYEHADGAVHPDGFRQRLRSTMKVTRADGTFRMAVNPSYRPVPPYQKDGTHGNQKGFLTEPWLLTCRAPSGRVASERVNVNLGETVSRVLRRCGRLPKLDAAPAFVQTSVNDAGSRIRVEVTAAGHTVRDGAVSLRSGGRDLETVRLHDGVGTARLSGVDAGDRVIATYAGSERVRSASASTVLPLG